MRPLTCQSKHVQYSMRRRHTCSSTKTQTSAYDAHSMVKHCQLKLRRSIKLLFCLFFFCLCHKCKLAMAISLCLDYLDCFATRRLRSLSVYGDRTISAQLAWWEFRYNLYQRFTFEGSYGTLNNFQCVHCLNVVWPVTTFTSKLCQNMTVDTGTCTGLVALVCRHVETPTFRHLCTTTTA